ncbi:MAG: hypothetical protein A2958_00705 [Candidatus Levybacteria bacterium RIFCSPLOWO2_01_FULL_38_13]|nr:MAG: hypothetical protein A2629_00600 [Candidatus Levybacteria bacterium RIFCSPHIGHO2_01_FULL_41_15]OGH34807.1 MAG: hypothetical protein A2958_00705 [Candidatus Levybacteria bacterium RIFCSPLOWO2_01_FULL_38_13]
MKLPLRFGKKKEEKQYFLALVLRNEKVNAVFFEEELSKVKVLARHSEYFENSIEEASLEEFLDVLDKAVSTAEQSLVTELETVKTIFGVKGSWIGENKIKKEYLLKLKKISDELGLLPIGFIVIIEAISHLLQQEEGAPLTAIVAETGKKYISVAHVKGGRILEFKTSQILESPAQTVDTILKHFSSSEILPARILIFNGDEDESQEFINHSWSKSLPFLHLPKVGILSPDFDARAVLFGAAQQMGFEILGDVLSIEEKKEDIEELSKPPQEQETLPTGEAEEEIINEKIKNIPQDSSLEYFGFLENKDIAKEPLQAPPEEKPEEEITGEKIEDLPARLDSAKRAGQAGIPKDIKVEEAEKKALPINASFVLTGVKVFAPRILKFVKKIPAKISFSGFGLTQRGKVLLIPIVIFILIIILSLFYFFLNKATVVLSLTGQPSEKTQDVIFAVDSPTDSSRGIIGSDFLASQKDGNISTKATGKKEVGDKAKGTVTIFNNSSTSQALAQGITITSSNDLEFALDKGLTVASASGDIFSGTTPGKVNVNVTAKAIGQEYNLPSNTKFSIGGRSSVAAKNDNAFSGGSKKELTVVSKNDIVKLERDLPKSLEQKAKDDLNNKISQDQVLLPVLVSEELVKGDFSKKEGDETNQVSLKGTVEFKGIAYKKKDIENFSNEILKREVSENLTIEPKSIKVDVSDVKTEESKVSAQISIKALLIPKIDSKSLVKQIKGKSFKDAESLLSKYSQVSDIQISLSLNLPFFPKRIPLSEKNIQVKTSINE